MPLNLADIPHPPVPGFKPLFRTLKDPKYDQFLRWVRDELSPLQKEYGIQIGQGQQGPQDVTGAPGQPQPPPPPQGGPVNNPPGQRPETGQAQGKGQVQGQGQLPNPSAPQPQPPRRGQ